MGLVIITPAAGFVNLSQSMFMGAFGGIICNLFLSFFKRFDIDDSLDVFACHGMGGIIGLLQVFLQRMLVYFMGQRPF